MEHRKIKRKKLSSLSKNSSFKKKFFKRFNEHLPHCQFKSNFFNCNSQYPDFGNIYELLTVLQTYTYREREDEISRTYQYGTKLPEILTREKEKNDSVDGKENLSESGKKLDNRQDSNTTSLNKIRLEGKFVNKNVINKLEVNN